MEYLPNLPDARRSCLFCMFERLSRRGSLDRARSQTGPDTAARWIGTGERRRSCATRLRPKTTRCPPRRWRSGCAGTELAVDAVLDGDAALTRLALTDCECSNRDLTGTHCDEICAQRTSPTNSWSGQGPAATGPKRLANRATSDLPLPMQRTLEWPVTPAVAGSSPVAPAHRTACEASSSALW
jgi:hypothetical protein